MQGSVRIRVLHVDDNSHSLEDAKQILLVDGDFEIESTTAANDALKKIRAKNCDLVVSNYEIPEKNGLQFLKELI